jgi:pimeloyl-ACP methyl ester carboxylesterase
MPYAEYTGARIYYEIEGSGQPLVLGHGGGDSLEMWRKAGYTDALKENFQLVLLDFPGHGRSERPESGGGMTGAVVAVLDAIGIEKAHYFGYSAGGTAGFHLALEREERFFSFVLGGITPYAWPETMVRAVQISIDLYKMLIASPELYLLRMQRLMGRPLTSAEREHFLNQDAEGRIAGLSAQIEGPFLTNEDLAKIKVPCLLYCGEEDPFHPGAKEAADHILQGRFLSLPGLNHISAMTRKEAVLPYLMEFWGDLIG